MTRAFSIVELVIAIALLGLVAALALPAGVALLANEGRRSGVFVCESSLRSVRDTAMREGVIMELGAIEDDGAWTLVARPYEIETDTEVRTEEDEPGWENVGTLPNGFAFRFSPMPTIAESFDALPEPPASFTGEDIEPERVALVLPSGAVESVGTWRLVTEQPTGDRVDLLNIARWTGAITPERETDDNPLLDDGPQPEPQPEPTP